MTSVPSENTTRARAAARRRAVARVVRSSPGYALVTTRVLPALRANQLVHDVVGRALRLDGRAGHRTFHVRAGRFLAGPGVSRLPVVVVDLVGATEAELAAGLREIAMLQVQTRAFRPVVVTDLPAFGLLREYGYPMELVLAAADWSHADLSWDAYAGHRLAAIVAHYRGVMVLRMPNGRVDPHDRIVLVGLAEVLGRDHPSVDVVAEPPGPAD